MGNPRLPLDKAKRSGAYAKNPARYKNRKEPRGLAPLSDAPAWMSKEQNAIWDVFRQECPWLNESHRALLEIATVVRARIASRDEVGVHALGLLRQILGQMGASPADASKINFVDDEEEADPADKYFARNIQ